ncbi:hypothetical protein [Thalassotalea profundi]|uniref:STAS/SEC14 domain-containing protein n=1 Tax=Thalassotalea profundi TaxID=2036687 RepID=A0ABQ3IQT8_9GAMM|nr:hypothetical protein [Thalassotalea profundi]GHE89096.1 hypothetical protein GCM10011501_18190 [Thalassotalea profundi]
MIIHGDVSFIWNGDLIEITSTGPFNELGLSHSISKVKNSILDKNIKSWRRMEIWDDETLGSPECIVLSKEKAKWFIDHGCYASAIVVSNNLQKALLDKAASGNVHFFDDVATARKWLDEQSL